MNRIVLACHPATPCAPVRRLTAAAERGPGALLRLHYRLEGVLAALALPPPAAPERTDGLWRHTCFEAFLRRPGEPAYVEVNVSPSGAWALYRFEDYRAGMSPAGADIPPAVRLRRYEQMLDLTATIDLAGLAAGLEDTDLDLALTAVIETADGLASYWACRHPGDKPDFHHPAGFALALARRP